MTPPDLKPILTERPNDTTELRRLLAGATPGPWHVAKDFSGEVRWMAPDGVRASGKHKGEPRSPKECAVVGTEPLGACGDPDCCPQGDQLVLKEADAALIVAAVNALPALLTELDALRAVEREARALLKYGGAVITDEAWAAGMRPRAWYPSLDLRAALADLAQLRTEGEK